MKEIFDHSVVFFFLFFFLLFLDSRYTKNAIVTWTTELSRWCTHLQGMLGIFKTRISMKGLQQRKDILHSYSHRQLVE